MPVTHPFVSAKSDGGDATLVRPSNWNDEHVMSAADRILGRLTAGAGDVEELTAGQVTTLLGLGFVRKSADEIVNNSNTLQDDDALLLAIGASQTMTFAIYVVYDSGATPDFKCTVTGPAGSVGYFSGHP